MTLSASMRNVHPIMLTAHCVSYGGDNSPGWMTENAIAYVITTYAVMTKAIVRTLHTSTGKM